MKQPSVEAVPRHQGGVGQRAAASAVSSQQVAQSSDVERSQLHRSAGEDRQLRAGRDGKFGFTCGCWYICRSGRRLNRVRHAAPVKLSFTLRTLSVATNKRQTAKVYPSCCNECNLLLHEMTVWLVRDRDGTRKVGQKHSSECLYEILC